MRPIDSDFKKLFVIDFGTQNLFLCDFFGYCRHLYRRSVVWSWVITMSLTKLRHCCATILATSIISFIFLLTERRLFLANTPAIWILLMFVPLFFAFHTSQNEYNFSIITPSVNCGAKKLCITTKVRLLRF